MKSSIKKISFLICSVAFFSATINLMSITSVQAEEKETIGLEPIKPRGFEPYYYIGTQSWCCFDGSTGCIPLNC